MINKLSVLVVFLALMMVVPCRAEAEESIDPEFDSLPTGSALASRETLHPGFKLVASRHTAGEIARLQFSTVLNQDWLPGYAVAFSEHWMHRVGLQHVAENEAAYLSLTTPLEGVQWERKFEPLSGIAGGDESPADVPVFVLRQGVIPAGTELKFVVRAYQLPDLSIKNFRFFTHIRQREDQLFQSGPTSVVPLNPGELAQFHLSASSLAEPGQMIDLQLRLTDRFNNLIVPRSLSLDLLVNGTFLRRANVTTAYSRIEGIQFDVPGIYVVEIRSGGGGMTAKSNPVLVSDKPDKIIWADIGTHSTLSDGMQTPDEIMSARQGHFDLVLPADHRGSDTVSQVAATGEADTITDTASLWVNETAGKGSHMVIENDDGRHLVVALAEDTTDVRYLTPDNLRLTQVVGPHSDYRWLGDVTAGRGYRTGFVAINHSHQYARAGLPVYTAVLTPAGGSWFDSLYSGQTYISVGEKITLIPETDRVEATPQRELGLEVVSAGPISSVSLIKNGTVFSTTIGETLKSPAYVLSVSSSSAPYGRHHSRPRNGREWIGFFSTRDTIIRLEESKLPGWLLETAPGQRRVDFLTHTHGTEQSLVFELSDPTPDTVLELGLASVYEDAAWVPQDRLPQQLGQQKALVTLAEMDRGAVRQLDAAGYSDRIEVRPLTEPLGEGGKMRFTFTDRTRPRPGDYYYFHVQLVNGSYAYSSPLFVENK